MDGISPVAFALGNPLILRIVLSKLTWRDLESCRLTCEEWASAVDSLIDLRGSEPQVYMLGENVGRVGDGEHYLRTIGLVREAPDLRLVFVRNALPHHIRNSWLRRVVKHRDGSKERPLLFLFARTAYGTIENFGEGKALVSGFSIPHINGVRIFTLRFDMADDDYFSNSFTAKFSPELEYISEDNYVKCVLVFTKKFPPCDFRFENTLLSYLLSRQKMEPRHFAIGGGAVDRTKLEGLVGDPGIQRGVIHLLFCVPRTMESTSHFGAYSGVLWTGGQNEDKEAIEYKLKEMAQNVKLLRHSVAMIFSGDEECEVAVKLYKKYFPATPLVGCETISQIGIDNYEIVDDLPHKTETYDPRYKFKDSTCTLVILTWKYMK